MKKFIVIQADCNDADYLMEKSEITDQQIEEVIKPVIVALEKRKAAYEELDKIDSKRAWNELHHNWETSEYGDTPPQKMYEGELSEDQIDAFQEFVPWGEYGVHTIYRIEIVFEGETLFNL